MQPDPAKAAYTSWTHREIGLRVIITRKATMKPNYNLYILPFTLTQLQF